MSDDPKTKEALPKIRTFAADLERVRGKKADTDPKKDTTDETTENQAQEEINAAVHDTETASKKTPPKESAQPKKRRPIPHIPDATKQSARSTETNSIPPFHTLDKGKQKVSDVPKIDTDAIEAKQEKVKPSVLESVAKRDIDIGEEDNSSGTIVSDVKRNRFNFFSELIASIKASFVEIGEMITGSSKRTYATPNAERRKGVIQTATSTSGRFATNDHSQVLSRLRKSKDTSVKTAKDSEDITEVEIPPKKETESDIKFIDTKVEQDPTHLLEAPDAEANTVANQTKGRVTLPTTKKDTERKITNVTAEVPKRANTVHAVVPNLAPIIPSEPPVAQTVTPESREPIQTPQPQTAPSTGNLNTTTLDEESALEYNPSTANTEAEQVSEPTTPRRNLSETNLMAIGSVASIVSLVVMFLIFQSLISLLTTSNQSTDQVATYNPFLTKIEIQTPPITNVTNNELTNIISEILANTDQLTAVIPMRVNTPEPTPLSTEQIFTMLGLQQSDDLSRALGDIAFGGSNTTVSFIAFEILDHNEARAGMLSWEQTLAEDLEFIFGSYQAGTSTSQFNQLSPFTDDMIDGFDVRVLTGAEGVHMIYGFLPNKVLLITNTEAEFAQIADTILEKE